VATIIPDVSVVLAVKNEATHIQEALASILDQWALDYEVIVVDDGSTDDTLGIVAREYPDSIECGCLRLYANPGVGKVSAFNYGVAQSQAPFVCLFAGDDIMPVDSLAARWHTIRNCPADRAIVGLSKILTMSDDDKEDGVLVPRTPGRGALSGACYMMNRRAVERLFPVPEHLPNEDTWLELALTYLPDVTLVHSDIVGCQWRVHANNSMNYRVPFGEFNRRYTARMAAIGQFLQRHLGELTDQGRRTLAALARCEEYRASGRLLGVLTSGAPLVPTLRAAALSTPIMYAIRRRLYGLLSGW